MEDVLIEFGLNVGGWTLSSIQGISEDGTVLVGGGTNPDGFGEGWMAVVPRPLPVPVPAFGVASRITLVVILVAVCGLALSSATHRPSRRTPRGI